MNTAPLTARILSVKDRYVILALVVAAVLVRLPFWRSLQLVTYDGTYYLAQAESLLAGRRLPNGFPLGYPFFVGLFDLVCGDLVVAAQCVSFLSGLGAVVCLYLLAKHFVRKDYAILAAVLLAANPLFIRYTLMTMTESFGIFLVLLALVLFVRGRFALFGLAIGLATITRPELGLIAVALMLGKLRQRRTFITIALGFACVYALNAAVLSRSAGRPILLNKTGNFMLGRTVRHALLFDDRIDDPVRRAGLAQTLADDPTDHPAVYYAKRLPADLALLVRHLLPVILALSVLGLWRSRSLVLASPLLFLPILPLFAPRSEDRFMLAFIPVLLVFAMVGIASLPRRPRRWALVLVAGSLAAWPLVNRTSLDGYIEETLIRDARAMAVSLGGGIAAGDLVADRKPYFPFYAGARFELLPAAPYDLTLRFLCDEGFDYLALRKRTIMHRPALRGLLDDKAVLLGEDRLQVLMFSESGDVLMRVLRPGNPLSWRKLPVADGGMSFPAWSADGSHVSYVSEDADRRRHIGDFDLREGRSDEGPNRHAPGGGISWSPDGARVAFASAAGGDSEIMIGTRTAEAAVLFTRAGGANHSPSWSPDGDRIAFISDRSGRDEVWMQSVATGEARQVTSDGGNSYPTFSPDGRQLAWTKSMSGVVILDLGTGIARMLGAPLAVHFATAWSPDGAHLAVTGADWGSWDIYLVRTDGTAALLLTKFPGDEGMPSWSPDGNSLALVSDQDGTKDIWILGNLQPFLARLAEPQAYLFAGTDPPVPNRDPRR